MNWQTIIENLGIFGIISGLITWLLKSIGDNFINKKIRAYEQELKLKSQDFQANINKMLQSHKSELELIRQKASRLHEKRLTVIEELYKKIVQLERELRLLAYKAKVSKPNEREKEFVQFSKTSDVYSDFVSHYKENKIYFTEKTCEKIKKVQDVIYSSMSDYYLASSIPMPIFDKLIKKVNETIENDIPEALSIIEIEFRELIGVNKRENDH